MTVKLHLLLAGLLAASSLDGAAGADGPYDIKLHPTAAAPAVSGQARLVFAASPFGIAVTADGRARYDIQVTAAGLPGAGSSGAYVAWATSTDLTKWVRLGTVKNGTTTVGHVDMNKFLLVITAEPDSAATTHSGPTVLHGTSPSGWLQSFL
ncbi:MAG TPA: hypothetical protein VF034_09710, partial [Gemmatimonadaceae bacterium]